MQCPKCGLINAPNAERCDCGRSFVDGSVANVPKPPATSGEQLRKAGCLIAVIAAGGSVALKKAAENVPLLGVVGDLLMVAMFVAFAVWVIGTLRMRGNR
jgi:hypothetical protein